MAGELYWTWQELEKRVQKMACGLRCAGIEEGQVLAMSSANSPMQMVLILACLRAGIVVLPLNPRFPEQKVLAALQQSGASAYWSDDGLAISGWEGITLPDSLHKLEGEERVFSWDENRVCTLVMTSGSSGFPKMAAHSFACHRASAQGSQSVIPLKAGDSWLLSLPLFHIGGLATMFRCLLSGAALVFPDHRSDLAQTLVKREVTHVSMVNTQLYRLLNQEGFAFEQSAVRVLLMGGGYVSASLAEQCQKEGITVLTSYGMTEMGSQICTGEPVFLDSGALTSGEPLSHCDVRVTECGEIQVRGPSLFCGYWEKGRLTRKLTDDGWFATGDTGRWLGDKIQIIGRIDSQFVSGGENIQPEAIEKVLLEIPGIEQAVVVPVANLEYGHRPVAFVRGKDCQNNAVWQSHIRSRLPGFMVPDQFLPWPDVCNGSQLKVNRRELMEIARNELGQDGVRKAERPVLEQQTMINNSNNAVSSYGDLPLDLPLETQGPARAFIAFMLPLDLSAAVHKKVQRFGPPEDSRRVRWTPPQNYHLTLRFLGDSTPEQLQTVADELRTKLKDFQRFICMSGGVDYLPNHNQPRVMTLKIHSGRRMEDLHKLCEDIARNAGFGPDNRFFRPHVTLARTGRGDTHWQEASSAFSIPWRLPGYRLQVGEVALVVSELGRNGTRYKVLESFPLA